MVQAFLGIPDHPAAVLAPEEIPTQEIVDYIIKPAPAVAVPIARILSDRAGRDGRY